MLEEAKAEKEEEIMAKTKKEVVLGDNISQDYCFKVIHNLR